MTEPFRLNLPDDVVAIIEAHFRANPGHCFIAKITREAFTGENFATSGRPGVEFAAVPLSCLPELREVVVRARAPKPEEPTPKTSKKAKA